jgi:hypothetical protein
MLKGYPDARPRIAGRAPANRINDQQGRACLILHYLINIIGCL